MALPILPAMIPVEEEVEAFSFPIPPGFRAPEDIPDGEAFDATVRVRIQDGQVFVDSINGSMLGSAEDEEVEDETYENEEENRDSDTMLSAEVAQLNV